MKRSENGVLNLCVNPHRETYAGSSRRKWRTSIFALIALMIFGGAAFAAKSQDTSKQTAQKWDPADLGAPLLRDPIWVYNDWSAYDELSDRIPLTEALAMKEMSEIVRLKKFGVHFDYYMMDAFWFDPNGGYRTWRKPNWPDGPDRWLAACKANGLKPGMWFGTNWLVKINAAPQWKDSLNKTGGLMSFTQGGFLPDLMNILEYWYGRGVRMFEFDFADFSAATPEQEKTETPEEIREGNEKAFRNALKDFRRKHPDIVLVAFNGFGGDFESTAGPFPFKDPIDLRWLEVFDTLYAGDPRPSDVPETSFWRSMDIYSDHMVRRYEESFVPLERIDPTSFMIGDTGTIYYRKTHAWKGMLLLMAARGGWINTIHGNLEFLSDADARWFAKVEDIYQKFKAEGVTKTFGEIPGDVQPYGFGSIDSDGEIYTVVNPAQAVEEIELPLLTRIQKPLQNGRVIFRDAGFVPVLKGNRVRLGPGQLAAVGFGKYANPEYDLGIQDDVVIPDSIEPIAAEFKTTARNTIEATIPAPEKGDLRIIFQQRDMKGNIKRSWPGGPPNGIPMGQVLKIHAGQDGKDVPVEIDYDKKIWSGLSWGAGEIKHGDFAVRKPIIIQCSSREKDSVVLEGHLYVVVYKKSYEGKNRN
jgi:hypothetical protein